VTPADNPPGSKPVTGNKRQRAQENKQERREQQERDMCHLVGRKLHMAQTYDEFFLLYFHFVFLKQGAVSLKRPLQHKCTLS